MSLACVGCAPADDVAAPSLPRVPVCAGCLCLDPSWSCNDETWLAADGGVVDLAPEAGFLELEARCFESQGQPRCVEPARMWYSFQPADSAPSERPLAVFLNGSAHWAESALLFSTNTGKLTLDPRRTGASSYVESPHSWTRFANLLYPDPRHAGFSYALGDTADPSSLASTPLLIEQELADLVRFLVRFLRRHPQLRGVPVILVAESYAGIRATLLLDMVLHYGRLRQTGQRFVDPELADELQAHFQEALAVPEDGVATADDIARQFGHQVLIQPVVAGSWQMDAALAMMPWPDCVGHEELCAATRFAERDELCNAAVVNRLLEPQVLSAATMVDATSVAWLGPAARHSSVRFPVIPECGDGVDIAGQGDWAFEPMVSELGELAPTDSYYLGVVDFESDDDAVWEPDTTYRFLSNVRSVHTFITNAALDSLIYGPSIPAALRLADDAVSDVALDATPRDGVARPGWMAVQYREDWAGSDDVLREIRFPPYAESGHCVPAWQPAEILDDVQAWFETSP